MDKPVDPKDTSTMQVVSTEACPNNPYSILVRSLQRTMTVARTATPSQVVEIDSTTFKILLTSPKMKRSKRFSGRWNIPKADGDNTCESQYEKCAASSANTLAAKAKVKGEEKARDFLEKEFPLCASKCLTSNMKKSSSEEEVKAKAEANAKVFDRPEKVVAEKPTHVAKTDRS